MGEGGGGAVFQMMLYVHKKCCVHYIFIVISRHVCG